MHDSLRSRRDAAGRFTHPWQVVGGSSRGLADLLRWRRERSRNGVSPDPPLSAFEVAQPEIAPLRNAAGELRMTWVGHATFLIQLDGVNILTDPVWSRRASPVAWAGPSRLVPAALDFESLPPIDVVIQSHDHYDHLDSRTVRRLNERFGRHITWVAPLGHVQWFGRRGVENVIELDWWQRSTIKTAAGPLDVQAAPAQHWSRRSPFGERSRLWASFVMRRQGSAAVFFCGDSGYFSDIGSIGALGPFDAVLLPIGAYEPRWFMRSAHMHPAEAVRAWIDLGSSGLFTGMHWGTFRLADEPPLEPPALTREAWHSLGLPPDKLWIPRHGETRVARDGR